MTNNKPKKLNYVEKKSYSNNYLRLVSSFCNFFNFFIFLVIVFLILTFLQISPLEIPFFALILLLLVSIVVRNDFYIMLNLKDFISLRDAMPVAVTNKLRKYLFQGFRLVNGKNGFVLQNEYCVVFYSYIDRVFCVWDIVFNKNKEKWRYTVKEVVPVYHGLSRVSGLVLSYNFNLLSAIFNQHTRAKDVVGGMDLPKTYRVHSEVYLRSTDTFLDADYKKVETNLIKNLGDVININLASEDEITELPGISAILAKKIIKFRETTRQFTSVDDFIKTMKIKPHFEQQIRMCISASPVVEDKKVEKTQESSRSLDF